ncbi:heme peroxidase family protein [Piscinibacter sp.]|uniref:peroxidase family protein n=1 Tax=Piscinibacter sp. TaxID=1903157 RepID=UPI001DAD3903|nr:heme peroxidase family protein [Piscinibacter sp.]MBK7529414.1 heme peroxidase [Piscinibacter sp.]MBL0092346.1 heme peroxidase [Piscinibacter sp.]
MSSRHGREAFFIVGEGMRQIGSDGRPESVAPNSLQDTTEFRFSRFVPGLRNERENSTNVLAKLAVAMVGGAGRTDPTLPAGYTYLGQFVDHDMTLDKAELDLGQPVDIPGLLSQRSPTLDLDSLYGKGPQEQPQWYEDDGMHLRRGTPLNFESPKAAKPGFDLPRWGAQGAGLTPALAPRRARIPDARNDENLAVAQVHTAFIRFHNCVVDDILAGATPGTPQEVFDRARGIVTRHYQWMLRTDYLPRMVDPAVVDAVFSQGRRFFERHGERDATMPVEFSGAAFRLGHSMIRTAYNWNKHFNAAAAQAQGPIRSGHLFRLFRFSGTSGTLAPTDLPPGSAADLADLESGANVGEVLPANWVADFTRLFDMRRFGPAFTPAPSDMNFAMAIDTQIVDPLKSLPIASFGGVGEPDLALKRSLAFRNLARGRMLGLPSGQQLAYALQVAPLTASQIINGQGGVEIPDSLFAGADRLQLETNTPLWFYVLREAEIGGKNRLSGVGAIIVAETFHRAMQASTHSVVNDTAFRPTLGPGASQGRFDMADLLHYAFEGKADMLNPH